MRIYDYLFYKTYILAKQSRNFDNDPVFRGAMLVGFCVVMNVGAIIMLAEGLDVDAGIDFDGKYKYIFSIGLAALIYFYYSYKGRYKKIVVRYEAKANGRKQTHPTLVVVFYIAASFGLALLAALFKNKDWIFAP